MYIYIYKTINKYNFSFLFKKMEENNKCYRTVMTVMNDKEKEREKGRNIKEKKKIHFF